MPGILDIGRTQGPQEWPLLGPFTCHLNRRWRVTTITRTQTEVNAATAADLLQRYQRLILKTAGQWTRYHPDWWEDVQQEITMELWRVLSQRPNAPITYLIVVANNAAHKCLSRGTSVDRPLELKRVQHWEMVNLDVVMTSEDGDEETLDSDKVRRHQRHNEWESYVEDIVIARQLYLEIHGHLSRMERAVLRARLQGYRLLDMPVLLGLEYEQVRNAADRVRTKARRVWNGNTDHTSLPAPEIAQGRVSTTVSNSALSRGS